MPTDTAQQSLEMFRAEVREWLKGAVEKLDHIGEPDAGYDEELWQRRAWSKLLYEGRYVGLCWPKEYGGRGLDPAMEGVFNEECARAHVSDGLGRIGINLVAPAIMYAGTEEQKQRFLPAILKADEIWCEGFSEPNAGSDLAAASTTARQEGDKFIINGSKIWTSYAPISDRIYLLAKTSDTAPRRHNLTVFLLNMRQPGVEIRPLRLLNGRAEFAQVFFNDAVATQDEVLGEVNGGWPLSTVGAAGVRSMGAATAVWHKYMRIYEMIDQLERCACEAGAVDLRVAEFRRELELLRWHVLRCANMAPDAERMSFRAATQVIKLHWSALFQKVADAGLANNCPAHRDFWREAYFESRPTTIYGGSVQLQRNVIADQVLQLRKRPK